MTIIKTRIAKALSVLTAVFVKREGGQVKILAMVLAGGNGGTFKGTSDAVYQNRHLIEQERPDIVAAFAADHVYRMDVRQMARFHHQRGAAVSIAAVPIPIEKASAFGISATGSDGERHEFQEKPERAAPMTTDSSRAYASMGNYHFNPEVLMEALDQANRRSDTDFGRHILPRLLHTHRVFAYDFAVNQVPGIESHEEPGYWHDIGTIEAYRAAQRDVLGPSPRFNLVNPKWPIRGGTGRKANHMIPQAAMASAGASHFDMRADAAALA